MLLRQRVELQLRVFRPAIHTVCNEQKCTRTRSILLKLYYRAVQPVATCRQSPYLHEPAIVIMTHSYYDVIRAARAYGARNPRASYSHYAVILIVTSFATELARPSVTDERALRTCGHLTVFNI